MSETAPTYKETTTKDLSKFYKLERTIHHLSARPVIGIGIAASQATAASMIPRAMTAIGARRHKGLAARLFRIGEIIDRPSPSSPMPTPSSYHNAPGGGKPAKQHLKSPRPRAISRDI